MIVVDASVLVNALADDGHDGEVSRRAVAAGGDLAAPDLIDVETVAVLRRRWSAGHLTARRFSAAIDDLEDLNLERYPMLPLVRRAYELRANVTAYDATYVALAEHLRCSLLTADTHLAAAPKIRCPVTLVSP